MITHYKNIAEARIQLTQRGYSKEFTFERKPICCLCDGSKFSSEDLIIVEYHRFKGINEDKDPSIVVALEDLEGINKGLLIAHDPMIKNWHFINFLDKVKVKLRSDEDRALKSK